MIRHLHIEIRRMRMLPYKPHEIRACVRVLELGYHNFSVLQTRNRDKPASPAKEQGK